MTIIKNLFLVIFFLFICNVALSQNDSQSVLACRAFCGALQAHGINVRNFLNCPHEKQEPLLHQAIKANDWPLVEEYLKLGADPKVVNSQGKDAYDLAKEMGKLDQYKKLMPTPDAPSSPDSSFQSTGNIIRQARRRHGWTQGELAKRTGLNKRTIENAEKGIPPVQEH